MNGARFTADRATHRRIILTACFGALLVVLVAISGRGPSTKNLATTAQPNKVQVKTAA